MSKTDKAIDGIFGFGQGDLSVISQLASRGITPRVFSHCLKGQGNGGGILVLGEILEPSIVYSPLVPSKYVPLSGNACLFLFFCFLDCAQTVVYIQMKLGINELKIPNILSYAPLPVKSNLVSFFVLFVS